MCRAPFAPFDVFLISRYRVEAGLGDQLIEATLLFLDVSTIGKSRVGEGAVMSGGYMGKILVVDLATRSQEIRDFSPDDQQKYLGNKILGAKLLLEFVPQGADPLGEDNVLIITTGPLTGSGAPTSARFNATTKSPLTGAIGSSNCGGDFGIQLKRCGYDALVFKGKAASPVAVHLSDFELKIEDVSSLWGEDTEATTATVEKGAGSLVIGPAGENMVRFACIMSGDRSLGRCGLGAVMGSKKLKMVTAKGSMKLPIHDPTRFRAQVKKWTKQLRAHPITGDVLPRLGTANLVRKTNASNTLPARNFSRGQFEQAEAVSGEEMAATRLIKNSGCKACPIHCGRLVEFEGKRIKGPEFETIGTLGPNLENADLDKIIEWNRQLDLLGMDTISMGVTLGFVMELGEKGLLDTELEFGRTDHISQLIEDTAYRRGFGNEVADGTRELARRYGGADFAMQTKGLEYAAYEPRGAVGQGLGYATANRGGCHLDSGYMVFFEAVGDLTIDPLTSTGKAALNVMQQNLFEAVSAGGSCIFTIYAVIPGIAGKYGSLGPVKWIFNQVMKGSRFLLRYQNELLPLAARTHIPMIPHSKAIELLTGNPLSVGAFLKIGERGFNLERMFNVREGLRSADDTIAKRLRTELQRPDQPKSKVRLEEMLPEYYRIRGWDSDGVPGPGKLHALGLDSVV